MAIKRKNISSSWVNEKNNLLKEKLPKEIQQVPFYPDAYFYAQYYQDPLKGLHFMAGVIFTLLHIRPDGCMIDFYDEKQFPQSSGDMAGFYTKIKNDENKECEAILINLKYKDNPLAVGAILAHEMMHLYLFRLNLRLEDIQENELLTDLATINTGLSILILNGMSYSSKWHITIIMLVFGVLYTSSQQLAFGYFKPKEYGRHSLAYFKERNISAREIIGYLNPTSRYFIPHTPFIKGKNTTEFIKVLDKQHRKSNIIKGAIVAPFIALILFFWISDSISSTQQSSLSAKIDSCRAIVTTIENKVDNDLTTLDNLKAQMTRFENEGDYASYNDLVDTYNGLLTKVDGEKLNYKTQLKTCNNLIDQYNSSQ